VSLLWKQYPGAYPLKARHYAIADYGDGRIVGWWIPTMNYPRKVGEFPTLEAARIGCDEHYAQHEGAPA
jgi:hypothetical protein